MANVRIVQGMLDGSRDYVGGNSVAFANGDFVSLTGGFAVKSTAGKRIIGIANGAKTFASDNQTVAKATLSTLRVEPQETMVELATSASIAITDVGKFYDLTSAQIVDVATALASETGTYVVSNDTTAAIDPVIIRQLKLEKFISASLGVFSFV